MNGKSTILYKCECGNLFDDWETYAKGTLPSYGVEKSYYGNETEGLYSTMTV